MTSVQIPDSVTKIGANAFYGCSGLKSIEIPASVLSIDTTSFIGTNFESMSVAEDNPVYDSRDNCNAIITTATNTLLHGCANTVIPSSTTKIDSYAFSGCVDLKIIDIPESVNTIGTHAFYKCNGLAKIQMPSSVYATGEYAFAYCTSLTDIILSQSLTYLSPYVFQGCRSLTNVTIPDSVGIIYDWVFYGCTNLTSVTIPDSVWYIGRYSFRNAYSLKTIYIPSGVTNIYSKGNTGDPFLGCSSTLKIYCGASESQEKWQDYWNYCATGKPLSVTYGVTREEYETLYKE
jgi:hypothetical protein